MVSPAAIARKGSSNGRCCSILHYFRMDLKNTGSDKPVIRGADGYPLVILFILFILFIAELIIVKSIVIRVVIIHFIVIQLVGDKI